MRFSSRLPIAAHILLCIAVFHDRHKITSTFLAGSVGVNPVVIRNTLGQLKAAGLIHVEAGVGGASLARPPADITLLDVFRAVEEVEPLFNFHESPNPDCSVGRNIHRILDGKFRAMEDAMFERMRSTTLQSLIEEAETIIASQNEGGTP